MPGVCTRGGGRGVSVPAGVGIVVWVGLRGCSMGGAKAKPSEEGPPSPFPLGGLGLRRQTPPPPRQSTDRKTPLPPCPSTGAQPGGATHPPVTRPGAV